MAAAVANNDYHVWYQMLHDKLVLHYGSPTNLCKLPPWVPWLLKEFATRYGVRSAYCHITYDVHRASTFAGVSSPLLFLTFGCAASSSYLQNTSPAPKSSSICSTRSSRRFCRIPRRSLRSASKSHYESSRSKSCRSSRSSSTSTKRPSRSRSFLARKAVVATGVKALVPRSSRAPSVAQQVPRSP